MRFWGLFVAGVFSFSVAAEVVCGIQRDNDTDSQRFAPFDGQHFVINLDTGNAHIEPAEGTLIQPLITANQVSTYLANRNTCEVTQHVSRQPNNSLQSFILNFDNCRVRMPGAKYPIAIVSVGIQYDAFNNRGFYREIHSNGTDLTVPYITLTECGER